MSETTPTATEIAVSELGETLTEQTDADISVDADAGTVEATGDTDEILTVAQTYAVRYSAVATEGAGEAVELLYDVQAGLETVRFENFREA